MGENSVDSVYRVAGAVAPNVKLRISGHRLLAGGQVTTTLCTCAALGLRGAYVGAFGNDDNGRAIRAEMIARGVDVSRAPVRHEPNRYAVLLVDDRTGDRTVLWNRSPALGLRPDEISADHVARARLVHVDDVDVEASLRAALMARTAGVPVTTDIDQVTDRTADLFEAATHPIVAAHVPEALTGERDVERALRTLRKRHAGWLCVTLGTRGAMLLEGDQLHHAPAFPIEAVDTTGAGDVFRGAFIYALLRGDAPADVLRVANAAAAISCTRQGAIDSVPTLAEVEALIATTPTNTKRTRRP